MDRTKTGALIAAARKEQNMTQKELAAALHVSDRAVSKWERGAGFPDISLLEPLADALGLGVLDLLRGQLSQDFHRHPSGQGPWNRLALTNLFFNAFTRPDFVAYRFGDREKPAVRLCRKFGMRMAYWTLRSRADVALAEQEGALPIFEEPDRPKEVTH